MLQDTHTWWALLRAVATLNLLAWLAVALWCWRARGRWPPETWLERRWQLLLCAGYVFGCAWRSLLPVYDVPRLVMVDSFWSSVIVGRSVATIAELCFAAQWALLLRRVSRTAGSATGLAVSHLVLPLIATAEAFSWYAVLTTSNIGHVVEESLWGLCALLLVVSVATAWPRVERRWRALLALWCVAGLAYVAYMFGVDVPMYWERWLVDSASGRGTLGLGDGALDAATRWAVSHRWEDWQSEMAWMTAYFSVAVWLSIAIVLVPTPGRARQATSEAPMALRMSSGWPRRTVSASDR
jgi:hypothetical protein